MDAWFERPLNRRAKPGGEEGVNGQEYQGGEFLPYYVPRAKMPQIDADKIPALLEYLTAQGVAFEHVQLDPHKCSMRQHVVLDHARFVELIHPRWPAIVSIEPVVLDGNHRCQWDKEVGAPLDAIQIKLEFEAAIEVLFKFPGVRIATHIKEGE